MVLALLGRGVAVHVHAEALLEIVARAGGGLALVEGIVAGGVRSGHDGLVVHTGEITVADDIGVETGVTSGIGVGCIVVAA